MTEAQSGAAAIFHIPADISFVDSLARGLWIVADRDPVRLSAMTVLLPNRRACRALQGAFLELAEKPSGAMLLPRLQPIGDIDDEDLAVLGPAILGEAADIPPAVAPIRRQMILARMILATGRLGRERPRLDQAMLLAQSLCVLMDEVATEGLSLDGLDRLVGAELAAHWQVTLDFFDLLRRQWPAILEAEGAIEPMARRNLLLDLQSRMWRERPPSDPVIVAGSTGSIPATQRLMASVAGLPRGMIVLPGLDLEADGDDWAAIEQDPSHPQFGMAQLLRNLGAPREGVATWIGVPSDHRPSTRIWWVARALLPASRTDQWPRLRGHDRHDPSSWSGLRRIDCRNEQEEALVIALALRQFLEDDPRGKAALATPDRGLAQRVAGELRRWSIEIDDSAGKPLSRWPEGAFVLTLAEAAAQDWAPIALLSLLKHPLCSIGRKPGEAKSWAESLDRDVLRGPRPQPGWSGIEAAIDALSSTGDLRDPEPLRIGLRALRFATGALTVWTEAMSPLERLKALTQTAEALAASDDQAGPERLYVGEAGEALAQFIGGALAALAGMPPCDAPTFTTLLQELLSRVDVRWRFGRHSRLFIWGPLEARLQQVDLMILGGMNEGTWPAQDGEDPWMSRPMRRQFGLPALERRIGLAAHDFQQGLGAKNVVLTRAQRVDGQPTVPSRWLLRLDALRACLGLPTLAQPAELTAYAKAIDDLGESAPCSRPAPRPGRLWRPKQLSVTRIELWRRDPYAIYASAILRLKKLDPLDQDPGAADLGGIVHWALDEFVRTHGQTPPANALAELLAIGRKAFGELIERPRVWAFWWPRFERIAQWFLDQEANRRSQVERSLSEVRAEATIVDGSQPFTITARADRLDILRDGSVAIIDYKTGGVPGEEEVRLGFAPQLTLEAMLAHEGAFEGLPSGRRVGALAYWQLKGGREAGKIIQLGAGKKPIDPMALANEAKAGLRNLLEFYDRDEAAYPALPDFRFAPAYNDYAHLERALEWSSGEDGS